jgi:hypothetical protein
MPLDPREWYGVIADEKLNRDLAERIREYQIEAEENKEEPNMKHITPERFQEMLKTRSDGVRLWHDNHKQWYWFIGSARESREWVCYLKEPNGEMEIALMRRLHEGKPNTLYEKLSEFSPYMHVASPIGKCGPLYQDAYCELIEEHKSQLESILIDEE